MCYLNSIKQPQSWCICTRISSANHYWAVARWKLLAPYTCPMIQQYSTTNAEGETTKFFYTCSFQRYKKQSVGVLSLWSLLMQPCWHVAFKNDYFKGSSCFGLASSSFYVTKGKTLEGGISIYSMVKYLGSKTLLYLRVDTVCRQRLNTSDSTFIPERDSVILWKSKEQGFSFATLKTKR